MNPRIFFWRTCYFLINPFRRLYWRIIKPQTRGVKVLVERDGKYLLVKLAYAHKKWTFPGGKVDKGESFENAASRELLEEANIEAGNLRLIGQYETQAEGKRDTVQCFHGLAVAESVTADPLEVSDAGWFPRADFPFDRSASVDKVMTLFDRHQAP